MFDALGTAFLLGFVLLFIAAGARGLLGASSTTGVAFGGSTIVLGIAIAAAAPNLIPPFRD